MATSWQPAGTAVRPRPGCAAGGAGVRRLGADGGGDSGHAREHADDHHHGHDDHDDACGSRSGHRWLPVVLELERDGLVELTEPADHLLQLVPTLARDPDRIALDARLDLGELVPDLLHELPREVVRKAALEADLLAHLAAARRHHLAPLEDLERQVAANGLDSIRSRIAFARMSESVTRTIRSFSWVRSTCAPLKS